MTVIDQLSLRRDPFGPACAATGFGVADSLLVARDRLLAAIHRGDPLTVLAGRPGMGKTLLLSMVEQACRADGIEVRTVARGDMAHTALGGGAELLLIDEADTINAATLTALAPGTATAAAPMMVFAASQPALHRISSDVRTTIVDLRPLDPSEAREFLLTRAVEGGRPELFTPEALDIIVDAGRGSPRLLRVLAGSAMFQAVSDGVPQVTADHAGLAAAMQGSLFGRPPAEPALPVPANDLGPRVDAEDRPRAVVAPLLRPMTRGRSAGLAFAASVAVAALVLPVFSLPEPATPSMAVPTASAASAPGSAHAAAFSVVPQVAPPMSAALNVPSPLAPRQAVQQVALAVPPLLAAPAPRILVAALDTGVRAIAIPQARIGAETGALARGVADLVRSEARAAGGADRALLVDVLAATRVRPAVVTRSSEGIQQAAALRAELAAPARPAPPEPPRVFAMPELAAVWRAVTNASDAARTQLNAVIEPVKLADLTAPPIAALKGVAESAQAIKTSAVEAVKATADAAKQAADESRAAKLAADQAKDAADQASAAKAAAEQAAAAKEAAEQAKAAKDAADQAKSSKDSADQAKAAKDAADQAKAAKEAADQAKAAKEASEQAKAAKEAAEQAKSAKDAADQAKAAKDAADQARAAKDAADQAKAAKDAADQAKAAKDAADQAKAAKDAADQAKAAKDAADQAKAAKDAADQAKAAKDAADQAKAAKDAADQAKSAKDAADQAKAAKDAADQAKAAKDAADQAKAAKDAADQAKAAKDAADQAKAAKEAADAAKEAAKAAKDAAKAAKDAAKAGKGN